MTKTNSSIIFLMTNAAFVLPKKPAGPNAMEIVSYVLFHIVYNLAVTFRSMNLFRFINLVFHRLFLYVVWGRNGSSFFLFIPLFQDFSDICCGQKILCIGGWPIHCRMFSSIHGLYPLDASSAPTPLWQSKMSTDIAKCWGWETKLPVVENGYFIQLFQHHPFNIELFWLLFSKINFCIRVHFFLDYLCCSYDLLVLITPILQYTNTVIFIVLKSGSRKCLNSVFLFQDFFILNNTEFWNLPPKY